MKLFNLVFLLFFESYLFGSEYTIATNSDNNFIDETTLPQYNSTALEDAAQSLYESQIRQIDIATQAKLRQTRHSNQGGTLYTLFNNQFQAIFFKQPVLKQNSELPNTQVYEDIDYQRQLSITAMTSPSNLKPENYRWSGIKKMLDDMIQSSLQANGNYIINFSSTLNKGKNKYIAFYRYSYFVDGQKIYASTKYIIYKDNVYIWKVQSLDENNKYIFNLYNYDCDIIE